MADNQIQRALNIVHSELVAQDRALKEYPDTIQTRTRIVEINLQAFRQKQMYYRLLTGLLMVFVFMIVPYMGLIGGSLSMGQFFMIFLLLLAMYGVWAYSTFSTQRMNDGGIVHDLKQDIHAFNRKFYREGKKIQKTYQKFIRGQCNECLGDPRDWYFDHKGYLPVS